MCLPVSSTCFSMPLTPCATELNGASTWGPLKALKGGTAPPPEPSITDGRAATVDGSPGAGSRGPGGGPEDPGRGSHTNTWPSAQGGEDWAPRAGGVGGVGVSRSAGGWRLRESPTATWELPWSQAWGAPGSTWGPGDPHLARGQVTRRMSAFKGPHTQRASWSRISAPPSGFCVCVW